MARAKVELYGGPLDGEIAERDIIDLPGKFPIVEHRGKKRGKKTRRYIYQARGFLPFDGEGAMPFDFIQVIFRDDEL